MSEWYSLYANAHNETIKLLAQTKTKLAVALTALVPVAAALLLGRLRTGIGLGPLRDFPQLMLDLFATALLPLFLFMAAAESFSGEYADRTIKLVLLRPISRAKAFASKVAALLLYAAALLAVVWLVSTAAALVLDGGAALAGLPDSIVAYAAAFVAMAAIGTAAAFVAQWLRSGVGTLALCVVLYAGAKLLPFFFPEAAAWSFVTYADWHSLWVGGAVASGKLLQIFVFLLASCMISYTAGWYLFEKKAF
ncbi:ABC transporter permease [Paenibacillus sp. GYB003]|uniref:ABC transporter permease n=1 Tax=Paenibacillus sp. GYB003 TaxID=2994392 RepID=UPI002F965082